ncbi:PREDICTED: probable WRKY transcription factor 33 [Camelina sativa]|uniref:Probable WRKY transcription factor 33 n=1 Tax=Camelina sativa TaxID=90675 RepID=A0A2P1CZZ5_CAMSA|nr:PREDICTED: probable WRKY transcription factor 33 [Camelina sativa]AVK51633.1 transcription factor WRKY33-2 [Camelina sativa]
MAASSLLTMDNSRTRQNMNGSAANWSQQNGRTSLDDLEIPKFRSFAPSSISISPSLVSPSTCFSPSVFLDSPAFVSSSANVLASPTTGALITNESNQTVINEGEKKNNNNFNFFDFSFQTQSSGVTAPKTTTTTTNSSIFQSQEQQRKNQSDQWSQNETRQNNQAVSYNGREQRKGEDGYNWRKYGQKQVKGSENPRSYYKCTFQNCPTKKKVERSLEGQITEIVYKGSHNHPKPQSTRRSSSSSSTFHSAVYNASLDHHRQASSDQPNSNNNSSFHHSDSFPMQQEDNTTSDSVGDDEFEQGSSIVSRDEEDCGSEPEAKRWKGENETNGGNGGVSKTVREPRIVVQTTSDIDILDDGYRWRKYGQKVVKGNPNPRSYYKCTTVGCPVRKHVERASHDTRAVITTYEGKHNHDVPAARGSGYATNRPSQDASSVPIRPAAIAGHSNYTTSSQAPYTLQMLHNNNNNTNAGPFGYAMNNNNLQTQQNFVGDGFSRAKEEPNEESSFFDSFMP